MAFNNDFEDGKASKLGPTYQYHKYFFEHDKHFLLSAGKGGDTRLEHLIHLLNSDFKDHQIVPVYLNVTDPININEIMSKVENWLIGLKEKDQELDLFISPGTPTMQTAWYFIHNGLKLKTKLYQTRPPKHAKDKSKPELVKIEFEQSSVPVSATILQQEVDQSRRIDVEENYRITNSIQPVYELARKIAHAENVTALIIGESGTGKEHLAHYIHAQSSRKDQPWQTVNCSAMNDQLLESRLFGYKKGSFTGAEKDTRGLFEEADGGSIFLDEIGDISSYMQQSLLRVLQQKEIQPIGGKAVQVDLRIICATNRDLPAMCKEGKFRWDLYWRLAIAELKLPSLLERSKDELKEMIFHFNKIQLKRFRKKEVLDFDKDAMEAMLNYHWPGNIRELENLIERLYVYTDVKVRLKDLPERLIVSAQEAPLNMEFVEKEHIKKVLQIKKGNQYQTQLALGFGSINTLKKKMTAYNINPEDYE